MLVTVFKENYVIVLAETNKDVRWLNQAGYDPLGEDFFQEVFSDIDNLAEEIVYLLEYGATFDDSDDEDSPLKVLEDLKSEGFIKI